MKISKEIIQAIKDEKVVLKPMQNSIFGFPVVLDGEMPKDEVKVVFGDWSQWITLKLKNKGKELGL